MKIGLILACAGEGRRLGFKKNKVFLYLNKKPIFYYSYKKFSSFSQIKWMCIVTQKNAVSAWQLAETDKVPDTAENANNYFKRGVNMDVLTLPYLGAKQGALNGDLAGNDEYWFYMVPDAPYGLIFQDRTSLEIDSWYEKNNQTHYTSGTVRFGKGTDGFEFIVGSNGSEAAFTD